MTAVSGTAARHEGAANRQGARQLAPVARGDVFAVSFTVHGTAAPAGSKTVGRTSSGATFLRDASRRSYPWRRDVAQAAGVAMRARPLLEGPLVLEVRFVVVRPRGHFGARGLRPSAPAHPIVRPDVTKLLRAVEDALTGVVWRDDAQVVEQHAAKVYGEPARCEVAVSAIEASA